MNGKEQRQPEPRTELLSQKRGDEQAQMLDDPRVVEALETYLAAVEAGEKPDRQAFLARHGDIASVLGECLDGLDALHGTASLSQPRRGDVSQTGMAGDWQPGTALGDFRIIREIGRGGMGVVYEAEQLSLSRRIALKVLPFAFTLDPRQLQRFKNEARAAAHLHHTNIVPIYSVGVERAVHFYAMQYIEGKTLAQVIEGLRQIGAKKELAMPFRLPTHDRNATEDRPTPHPSKSSPDLETTVEPVGVLATIYSTSSSQFFRSVTRLGIQAAEALEHAHQCGVVHRDIKPANLLVDDQGKLWITDFGLAQFHTDAGLTQPGDLLGTLRYMSPEQAGGQRVLLDHRTDIYSLGATLYELLTLQPLFDGADRQTLLNQILNDEPESPRTIEKSIPVELETIVLKALGKTPAERYTTAQELADDLSRFLHHEPIFARRTTLANRARKWARRHPSIVIATVVLCVITAAGSLVAAALIRNAYEQERVRNQQAEERFFIAKQAVDEMVKVSQEELADMQPFQGVRRRLLEASLVYYQKLIEQREDDLSAKADLTTTQNRVAKIIDDLVVLQGAGQFKLLGDRTVLDDLHLGKGQEERLDELRDQMFEQRRQLVREFQSLSKEERDSRFVDLALSDKAAIEAALSPQQLQRLGQIDLQLKGLHAFEDPQVVSMLKLNTDQRALIRAIQINRFFGSSDGPPCDLPGKGGPPHDHEDRFRSEMAEALALLSPDQKRLWQDITGEPFQGRGRPVFGGRPPRKPGGPFGGPHR